MQKLTREDLYSLEDYDRMRPEFRQKLMEHKKNRRLAIGPNANVYFEDRLTMQYQVQEMLRAEKIFQSADIDEELAAYNPLIPDGKNWKGTFMIEYDDPEVRRVRLGELIGIERALWFQVTDHDRVHPICNEDLERETEDKTSAVHFIRVELTDAMVKSLKDGAALHAGIDHPNYQHEVNPVPQNIRQSLVDDLD